MLAGCKLRIQGHGGGLIRLGRGFVVGSRKGGRGRLEAGNKEEDVGGGRQGAECHGCGEGLPWIWWRGRDTQERGCDRRGVYRQVGRRRRVGRGIGSRRRK